MNIREAKRDFCRQAGQNKLNSTQANWDWKEITREVNQETESILFWNNKKIILVK